jgi:hypothetical protein
MRRGAKPAKTKAEVQLPVARKSLKNKGSRVGDLEKPLAEALKREAETLEQQTATAEILRVISSSPSDVQPVFAAVLTSAARLCDASDATIFQVDGDELRIVAHEGPIPSTPLGTIPLIRGTAAGRAVLDRRTIHVTYCEALRLGDQLGMRPLVAHCYLGLGKVYRRTGRREQAREHLTTATTMYGEMDMRYWLEQAEAASRGSADALPAA